MLSALATALATPTGLHLDHNPALILRKFNKRTGKYTPDANDPAHLIYRTTHEHHIKTNVRGDGAHRSDTAERVHWRKVERNKQKRAAKCKTRPKYAKSPRNMHKPTKAKVSRKIPTRPFPAGRKFRA